MQTGDDKRKQMNRTSRSIATIAIVWMTVVACQTSTSVDLCPKKADASIVVVYDNDVHCGVEGYARMAGLRDMIADTAYTLTVSNGDYYQGGPAGALSKGQYIIDIMNSVGYDAVTLGNHEFDYKTPRQLELMAQFNAPVVCANFVELPSGKRVYAASVVKRLGKKKVGLVGVITPTTLYTEEYAFFDEQGKQLYDLCEKETYQLVQQAVNDIRKKVDYVIVLAHLGEDENETGVDSHGLVRATNGIDVVLDGHTHSLIPQDVVMNKDGKPVLVSQTGTKFQSVGKLVIRHDGRMSTELVDMKAIPYIDRTVRLVTDSIQAVLNAQTSRPICQNDVVLEILDEKGNQLVRYAETNVGDLVADAYRNITGADFAMTNGGGIRVSLPKGQLTYGDLVTLMPFDNYVCIVDITGAQLKDLLEDCTKHTPVEFGDFPQVSGIKFTIDKRRTEGDRITDLVILNKSGSYEPVEMNRTYNLATIDYCVTGGGFVGKLKQNRVSKPSIILYNECLIQYVTDNLKGHIGQEYAAPQGRIKIVEK